MRTFRVPCLVSLILISLALTVPASAGEIHNACSEGDLDQVQSLLAQDGTLIEATDENPTRDLPLHSAAGAGHLEVVRFLVESGARVDAGDRDASTPLHVAALRGHLDCVTYLVSQGADVAFQDSNGSWSLSFAVAGGQTEVITFLIEAGAPPELRGAGGMTLLHYAALQGLTEVFDMLMAAGMDPNIADSWERTPLWFVAGNGDVAMTEALISAGADVDHPTVFGETPLLRAVAQGHAAIVAILIDHDANLDSREARCGRTALHVASLNGYGDCVEMLTAAGASLSARDRHGFNPLDLAQRYSQDSSVAVLTAQGAVPGEEASPCPAESGCLAVCTGHEPGKGPALTEGEARLWYLGHSGFAVQTLNNLLVFDYFPGGRAPDEPALCNGFIDPKEIAGMKVTVFVSHEHPDHFTPEVFDWAASVADITYVMGCSAETDQALDLIEPRQGMDFDGVKVRTIASNDSGVGFLVEADGVTIYHAGDHANRQRDFSGPYTAEIDWLAASGARPDIALMPVSGCGFGDQEAVRLGVNYALEKMQPKVFIPVHSLNSEYRYDEFIDGCRNDFPQVRMVAPSHRGDHYDYRQGNIS